MNLNQTEPSPQVQAIKRLAVSKDQKRVLLALADAGDWTPLNAVSTLLGKTGMQRVKDAVVFLIQEHLVEGGTHGAGMFLRARPVEEWTKDEHFLLGIAVAWP